MEWQYSNPIKIELQVCNTHCMWGLFRNWTALCKQHRNDVIITEEHFDYVHGIGGEGWRFTLSTQVEFASREREREREKRERAARHA